ncbi:MAG: hypothetical protein ONB06_09660 [candidate division KSB1 bacterium]|nr:hypothetical protein [candidate division KSB1 bacterium]
MLFRVFNLSAVTALAEAKADGKGGFHLAAVAPARHDLRVHRGPEEVSLVLDIRTG